MNSRYSMLRVCLLFLVLAALCLPGAKFNISINDPWFELGRIAHGLATPSVPSVSVLVDALTATLAFALQGVALGAFCGLLLALLYRYVIVRRSAAFLRAIHELFWALLCVQFLGMSTLAGVLAIAIPYTGTFAKIYGELFEENDPTPADSLPLNSGLLSRFFYTSMPQAFAAMVSYTSYRLECGIRSSAVLGFIGLPTVGYYLESALKQGHYSHAAGLFYALVVVVATMRFWLRRRLLPVYLVSAIIALPPIAQFDTAFARQFFHHDIIPAPIRAGQGGAALWQWFEALILQQVMPGVINTLILGLLSLIATSLFALVAFPFISPLFGNRLQRGFSHVGLVFLRSAPEYFLAYLGLILWGPSLLPALVGLSLHNGAIIAHLLGRYTEQLRLRDDAPLGVNRYFYEVLPRIFRQFMAYGLYRFEIIMRETALLGLLGIPTLGFFIDSAFGEFRFDRAMVLLLSAAILNMFVDACARYLRRHLHLRNQPECL